MTTQDSVDYHTELFNRVSYYFLSVVFKVARVATDATIYVEFQVVDVA